MNCSRFETLLSDFMEDRLDHRVHAAMEEHRSQCVKCSLLVEDVRILRDDLTQFPEIRVSEDLIDRILEQTSGKPVDRSFWNDLVVPTFRPFLTQRFAFATVMMFVFISFAVNMIGPEFSASSYSSLSPFALVARADRFSADVYKKWVQFNDFKARAGQEIKLLGEDLFGRLDYHLITVLFESYSESIESEDSDSQAEQDSQQEGKKDE